ncbi:hypothetical protein GOP47_0018500 [Adiantum capillus-veneris]|uniref:Uncharacterized protein n=1 Tax=Adiantum capillus-veneris TaxID=13818 RepID=A0A9D4ZAR9_ADICA|nr:hypothetical protein GOP47_0018500 [Adiantum capillus-veneris]
MTMADVGKENSPGDQHHQNLKPPPFEHAAKLREVRDARCKRILARSSERLAYITASAGDQSKSPLLDKTNSPSPLSVDDVANVTTAAAATDADICIYLSDHETIVSGCDATDDSELKKSCNEALPIKHDTSTSTISESPTVENHATICQAIENVAAEIKVRKWVNIRESPVNILSKLNFCMQCSHVQHARFVCATCTALIFLAASCANGNGHIDADFMIYSPLAVVFFTDLLLYTGAYFLISKSEHLKRLEARSGGLPIVMQLLLSVCLDCSISASLICGGFVMLYKYHGHIGL